MNTPVNALAALLLLAGPVHAATYNWSFGYDGTTLTETSSSPMAGTLLAIGDTLQLTLQAAGSGYWSVASGDLFTKPLSPHISGATATTADTITTFLLNGSTVKQDIKDDEGLCCGEIGVGFWNFGSDLDFDTVVLDYEVTDSADPMTPLTGAFLNETWDDMVFTAATVPLPGSAALLGSALLAGGLAARRRRRAAKAA